MSAAELFQNDAPIIEQPVRSDEKFHSFQILDLPSVLVGDRAILAHPCREAPLAQWHGGDADGCPLCDNLLDGAVCHQVADVDGSIFERFRDSLPGNGMGDHFDVRMVLGKVHEDRYGLIADSGVDHGILDHDAHGLLAIDPAAFLDGLVVVVQDVLDAGKKVPAGNRQGDAPVPVNKREFSRSAMCLLRLDWDMWRNRAAALKLRCLENSTNSRSTCMSISASFCAGRYPISVTA